MQLRQNGTGPANDKGREGGSGMLMAIFVLFMVTSMGVALLFLSRTEVQLSQADGRGKVAYYYAEAGLEKGRTWLWQENITSADTQSFTEELTAAAGGGIGVIDFDLANLTATFDSDGNLTGLSGYGSGSDEDIPLYTLSSLSSGWHAAFLTNDPYDIQNGSPMVDTNRKAMITGVGAGPDRSLEIVQAIVYRVDLFPTPPAAITILGEPDCGADCAYFWGGEGLAKQYIGDDDSIYCPGGTPGLYVPTVGVIGSSSLASALTGMYRPSTYEAGGDTGADTFADLTTLPGGLDPMWTDCQMIIDMARTVRDVADIVADSSWPDNQLGTTADPKIAFIDGDYTLGPYADYAGVLLVTGELEMYGATGWEGMIMVIGTGDFLRHGTGTGVVSGGIIVADVAGPDRILFTDDDCAGQDDVLGTSDDGVAQSYYHDDGGGKARTAYCTSNQIKWQSKAPLEITSFVQR